MVGDIHNRIHIKQRAYALAYNRQTLQTHTGVNILLNQLRVIALTIVIELGEHIVPHFHETVAIAAGTAPGLAAAKFLATVIMDLGTRTAGAGTVLPEVVLLAQAGHMIFRNADDLSPNIPCLIVIFIDGGIHSLRLQAHPFRAGKKLPAPLQGFFLKVVTEGEVAQHLEIGAVTGSLADVFDITGTDTLLTGADTLTGRLNFAGEVGLHRCHTGIDQQQGLVILGNQGKAGQAQMILGFKELQEHLTQFVYAIRFMCHWELPPNIIFQNKNAAPKT